MKIYIQTDKATTNIFGLHTQPRKTTRYTKKIEGRVRLGGGGGGRKKSRQYYRKLLLPRVEHQKYFLIN